MMIDRYDEEINRLDERIQAAQIKWARLDAERKLLEQQIEAKEVELDKDRDTVDVYEKARILLQQSAEYAREQAKQQIETIVTNALQYIFGPLFSFQIELEAHGNKAVAEFYVISEYEGVKIKTRPQDARGGGVVDIVTLALRIAIIETVQPKKTGPLILDEPGKHVSNEYVLHLYEFLKTLSTMFDRQIIMITHNQHLAQSGDRAYEVKINDGISELIIVENT